MLTGACGLSTQNMYLSMILRRNFIKYLDIFLKETNKSVLLYNKQISIIVQQTLNANRCPHSKMLSINAVVFVSKLQNISTNFQYNISVIRYI